MKKSIIVHDNIRNISVMRFISFDSIYDNNIKFDGEPIDLSSYNDNFKNIKNKSCCGKSIKIRRGIFGIKFYGIPKYKRIWIWIKTGKYPKYRGCGCIVALKDRYDFIKQYLTTTKRYIKAIIFGKFN